MKKFLYKLLKSNKRLYDFIFNEIINDRELETIRKVVGSKHIVFQDEILDKNIDIVNCILVDVRIQDCNIKNVINNVMERCVMSNNWVGDKKVKDIEIEIKK